MEDDSLDSRSENEWCIGDTPGLGPVFEAPTIIRPVCRVNRTLPQAKDLEKYQNLLWLTIQDELALRSPPQSRSLAEKLQHLKNATEDHFQSLVSLLNLSESARLSAEHRAAKYAIELGRLKRLLRRMQNTGQLETVNIAADITRGEPKTSQSWMSRFLFERQRSSLKSLFYHWEKAVTGAKYEKENRNAAMKWGLEVQLLMLESSRSIQMKGKTIRSWCCRLTSRRISFIITRARLYNQRRRLFLYWKFLSLGFDHTYLRTQRRICKVVLRCWQRVGQQVADRRHLSDRLRQRFICGHVTRSWAAFMRVRRRMQLITARVKGRLRTWKTRNVLRVWLQSCRKYQDLDRMSAIVKKRRSWRKMKYCLAEWTRHIDVLRTFRCTELQVVTRQQIAVKKSTFDCWRALCFFGRLGEGRTKEYELERVGRSWGERRGGHAMENRSCSSARMRRVQTVLYHWMYIIVRNRRLVRLAAALRRRGDVGRACRAVRCWRHASLRRRCTSLAVARAILRRTRMTTVSVIQVWSMSARNQKTRARILMIYASRMRADGMRRAWDVWKACSVRERRAKRAGRCLADRVGRQRVSSYWDCMVAGVAEQRLQELQELRRSVALMSAYPVAVAVYLDTRWMETYYGSATPALDPVQPSQPSSRSFSAHLQDLVAWALCVPKDLVAVPFYCPGRLNNQSANRWVAQVIIGERGEGKVDGGGCLSSRLGMELVAQGREGGSRLRGSGTGLSKAVVWADMHGLVPPSLCRSLQDYLDDMQDKAQRQVDEVRLVMSELKIKAEVKRGDDEGGGSTIAFSRPEVEALHAATAHLQRRLDTMVPIKLVRRTGAASIDRTLALELRLREACTRRACLHAWGRYAAVAASRRRRLSSRRTRTAQGHMRAHFLQWVAAARRGGEMRRRLGYARVRASRTRLRDGMWRWRSRRLEQRWRRQMLAHVMQAADRGRMRAAVQGWKCLASPPLEPHHPPPSSTGASEHTHLPSCQVKVTRYTRRAKVRCLEAWISYSAASRHAALCLNLILQSQHSVNLEQSWRAWCGYVKRVFESQRVVEELRGMRLGTMCRIIWTSWSASARRTCRILSTVLNLRNYRDNKALAKTFRGWKCMWRQRRHADKYGTNLLNKAWGLWIRASQVNGERLRRLGIWLHVCRGERERRRREVKVLMHLKSLSLYAGRLKYLDGWLAKRNDWRRMRAYWLEMKQAVRQAECIRMRRRVSAVERGEEAAESCTSMALQVSQRSVSLTEAVVTGLGAALTIATDTTKAMQAKVRLSEQLAEVLSKGLDAEGDKLRRLEALWTRDLAAWARLHDSLARSVDLCQDSVSRLDQTVQCLGKAVTDVVTKGQLSEAKARNSEVISRQGKEGLARCEDDIAELSLRIQKQAQDCSDGMERFDATLFEVQVSVGALETAMAMIRDAAVRWRRQHEGREAELVRVMDKVECRVEAVVSLARRGLDTGLLPQSEMVVEGAIAEVERLVHALEVSCTGLLVSVELVALHKAEGQLEWRELHEGMARANWEVEGVETSLASLQQLLHLHAVCDRAAWVFTRDLAQTTDDIESCLGHARTSATRVMDELVAKEGERAMLERECKRLESQVQGCASELEKRSRALGEERVRREECERVMEGIEATGLRCMGALETAVGALGGAMESLREHHEAVAAREGVSTDLADTLRLRLQQELEHMARLQALWSRDLMGTHQENARVALGLEEALVQALQTERAVSLAVNAIKVSLEPLPVAVQGADMLAGFETMMDTLEHVEGIIKGSETQLVEWKERVVMGGVKLEAMLHSCHVIITSLDLALNNKTLRFKQILAQLRHHRAGEQNALAELCNEVLGTVGALYELGAEVEKEERMREVRVEHLLDASEPLGAVTRRLEESVVGLSQAVTVRGNNDVSKAAEHGAGEASASGELEAWQQGGVDLVEAVLASLGEHRTHSPPLSSPSPSYPPVTVSQLPPSPWLDHSTLMAPLPPHSLTGHTQREESEGAGDGAGEKEGEVLVIGVHLDLDLDQVLDSMEALAAWNHSLESDVAAALSLPPTAVAVLCHHRGSLIAEVALGLPHYASGSPASLSPGASTMRDPHAILQQLHYAAAALANESSTGKTALGHLTRDVEVRGLVPAGLCRCLLAGRETMAQLVHAWAAATEAPAGRSAPPSPAPAGRLGARHEEEDADGRIGPGILRAKVVEGQVRGRDGVAGGLERGSREAGDVEASEEAAWIENMRGGTTSGDVSCDQGTRVALVLPRADDAGESGRGGLVHGSIASKRWQERIEGWMRRQDARRLCEQAVLGWFLVCSDAGWRRRVQGAGLRRCRLRVRTRVWAAWCRYSLLSRYCASCPPSPSTASTRLAWDGAKLVWTAHDNCHGSMGVCPGLRALRSLLSRHRLRLEAQAFQPWAALLPSQAARRAAAVALLAPLRYTCGLNGCILAPWPRDLPRVSLSSTCRTGHVTWALVGLGHWAERVREVRLRRECASSRVQVMHQRHCAADASRARAWDAWRLGLVAARAWRHRALTLTSRMQHRRGCTAAAWRAWCCLLPSPLHAGPFARMLHAKQRKAALRRRMEAWRRAAGYNGMLQRAAVRLRGTHRRLLRRRCWQCWTVCRRAQVWAAGAVCAVGESRRRRMAIQAWVAWVSASRRSEILFGRLAAALRSHLDRLGVCSMSAWRRCADALRRRRHAARCIAARRRRGRVAGAWGGWRRWVVGRRMLLCVSGQVLISARLRAQAAALLSWLYTVRHARLIAAAGVTVMQHRRQSIVGRAWAALVHVTAWVRTGRVDMRGREAGRGLNKTLVPRTAAGLHKALLLWRFLLLFTHAHAAAVMWSARRGARRRMAAAWRAWRLLLQAQRTVAVFADSVQRREDMAAKSETFFRLLAAARRRAALNRAACRVIVRNHEGTMRGVWRRWRGAVSSVGEADQGMSDGVVLWEYRRGMRRARAAAVAWSGALRRRRRLFHAEARVLVTCRAAMLRQTVRALAATTAGLRQKRALRRLADACVRLHVRVWHTLPLLRRALLPWALASSRPRLVLGRAKSFLRRRGAWWMRAVMSHWLDVANGRVSWRRAGDALAARLERRHVQLVGGCLCAWGRWVHALLVPRRHRVEQAQFRKKFTCLRHMLQAWNMHVQWLQSHAARLHHASRRQRMLQALQRLQWGSRRARWAGRVTALVSSHSALACRRRSLGAWVRRATLAGAARVAQGCMSRMAGVLAGRLCRYGAVAAVEAWRLLVRRQARLMHGIGRMLLRLRHAALRVAWHAWETCRRRRWLVTLARRRELRTGWCRWCNGVTVQARRRRDMLVFQALLARPFRRIARYRLQRCCRHWRRRCLHARAAAALVLTLRGRRRLQCLALSVSTWRCVALQVRQMRNTCCKGVTRVRGRRLGLLLAAWLSLAACRRSLRSAHASLAHRLRACALRRTCAVWRFRAAAHTRRERLTSLLRCRAARASVAAAWRVWQHAAAPGLKRFGGAAVLARVEHAVTRRQALAATAAAVGRLGDDAATPRLAQAPRRRGNVGSISSAIRRWADVVRRRRFAWRLVKLTSQCAAHAALFARLPDCTGSAADIDSCLAGHVAVDGSVTHSVGAGREAVGGGAAAGEESLTRWAALILGPAPGASEADSDRVLRLHEDTATSASTCDTRAPGSPARTRPGTRRSLTGTPTSRPAIGGTTHTSLAPADRRLAVHQLENLLTETEEARCDTERQREEAESKARGQWAVDCWRRGSVYSRCRRVMQDLRAGLDRLHETLSAASLPAAGLAASLIDAERRYADHVAPLVAAVAAQTSRLAARCMLLSRQARGESEDSLQSSDVRLSWSLDDDSEALLDGSPDARALLDHARLVALGSAAPGAKAAEGHTLQLQQQVILHWVHVTRRGGTASRVWGRTAVRYRLLQIRLEWAGAMRRLRLHRRLRRHPGPHTLPDDLDPPSPTLASPFLASLTLISSALAPTGLLPSTAAAAAGPLGAAGMEDTAAERQGETRPTTPRRRLFPSTASSLPAPFPLAATATLPLNPSPVAEALEAGSRPHASDRTEANSTAYNLHPHQSPRLRPFETAASLQSSSMLNSPLAAAGGEAVAGVGEEEGARGASKTEVSSGVGSTDRHRLLRLQARAAALVPALALRRRQRALLAAWRLHAALAAAAAAAADADASVSPLYPGRGRRGLTSGVPMGSWAEDKRRVEGGGTGGNGIKKMGAGPVGDGGGGGGLLLREYAARVVQRRLERFAADFLLAWSP